MTILAKESFLFPQGRNRSTPRPVCNLLAKTSHTATSRPGWPSRSRCTGRPKTAPRLARPVCSGQLKTALKSLKTMVYRSTKNWSLRSWLVVGRSWSMFRSTKTCCDQLWEVKTSLQSRKAFNSEDCGLPTLKTGPGRSTCTPGLVADQDWSLGGLRVDLFLP